jgi:hypothetical protein
VYYEAQYGPVPSGMELDHLCRVKACVNPDHLEPVTHAENMRRGKVAKLTPRQVREIRERRDNGEKIINLSKAYGVTESAIYRILSGYSWSGA